MSTSCSGLSNIRPDKPRGRCLESRVYPPAPASCEDCSRFLTKVNGRDSAPSETHDQSHPCRMSVPFRLQYPFFNFPKPLHQHQQSYYVGVVGRGGQENNVFENNTVHLTLEATCLTLRAVATGRAGNCWILIKAKDVGLGVTLLCHHCHPTLIYSEESVLRPHDQWSGCASLMLVAGSLGGN